MTQLTLKQFYDLRTKQKKLYKTFVPMNCYILRKEVAFNAIGFEHLYKDGRGHYRNILSATARLNLLEYVPTVISQSRMVKEDIKSPSETTSGKVEKYYVLYYKIGSSQMNVVVTLRTVGNGSLHFYGIRPNIKRKKPPKRLHS